MGDVRGIGHYRLSLDWSFAVGSHLTVEHGFRDIRGVLLWLTIPTRRTGWIAGGIRGPWDSVARIRDVHAESAALTARPFAGWYLGSQGAQGRTRGAACELGRPNRAPTYQHLR
ncbi:MAG: hypothetical protein ACRDRT_04455, partial [Pseudonocardiaceae bacterium]